MVPFPSNQTSDVQVPQPFEDVDGKHDSSFIDMPLTPKAAPAKLQRLSCFAVQSVHVRECFAESLGTFVMILFGMGVNNQVTNSQDANGTWLSINMCWGIGVLTGVYCTEGIRVRTARRRRAASRRIRTTTSPTTRPSTPKWSARPCYCSASMPS